MTDKKYPREIDKFRKTHTDTISSDRNICELIYFYILFQFSSKILSTFNYNN